MPSFKSLILKKQERGEADELVVLFSRDLGWIRGIAKNSRKSRIRFGGHLEPFSLVDVVLRLRRRDDLVWIDESHVIKGFLNIRSSPEKTAAASLFLEIASAFLPGGPPDERLFDFLGRVLDELDSSTTVNTLSLFFDEIRLLGILGFQPGFEICPICGTKLVPGDDVLFAVDHGGGIHRRCNTGDRPSFRLSPDTLAVLRKGSQAEPGVAGRLRLGSRGLEEIRRALSAFERYIRGADLNTLLYMEKMARWRKTPPGSGKR
ncbi:MAG: DNA repair protein RecO [Pseudomonadota bacterium]